MKSTVWGKRSMPIHPKGPAQGRLLKDCLSWAVQELQSLGDGEARASAECLLSEITGLDRVTLYLGAGRPVTAGEAARYRTWVARRKRRVPTAYIIKKAYFRNEILEVGPGCLIPRPETEILVQRFIENSGFKKDGGFCFLDLCSGSGAIGISVLRHYPQACGTFADNSLRALGITRRNLRNYGLLKRGKAVHSDMFKAFTNRKWDVIFCNPPYFASGDWEKVEPEILKEPPAALNGGRDGLKFYRRLAGEAPRCLQDGGWLVLEVGLGQARPVADLLQQKNFKCIHFYKDDLGIERVVMTRWLLHG